MRRARCLGSKTHFCTGPISFPILERLRLLSEDSNEKVTRQDGFFLLPEEYFSHWKEQQLAVFTQLKSRSRLVCHDKMEQTTTLKRQVTSIAKEVQHRKYPRI